jgi:group II intron reverse transcriptase/maturase
MNRSVIAQKQRALAVKACDEPEYRFSNLYDFLHWDKWIRHAALTVLARPGSNTAGVDGKTRDYFKDNFERLISELKQALKKKRYQPQPVRRAYIPKANGKKRPLGIPTLLDRIVQEGIRMALDPIYESDFQPYSFGFRKGRCTMDAIAVLMPLFNSSVRYYYVIEGDIKNYFDTVNHHKLMVILRRRIKDKALLDIIWKFLKAGVMEEQLFAKSTSGVPQGGIISPLLANAYLNEFDKWAKEKWMNFSRSELQKRRKSGQGNYIMVRYADDFVVASNDSIYGVRQAKEEIKAYLESELRLTLSDEKTLITHINDGFSFLGFHIRRVKPEGRWVVHLRPMARSIDRVKAKIKELTSRRMVLFDEVTRLTTLNAIVRGWCEYYKHTSLVHDLEQISRYTWHRYHGWLLKKIKGSRKQQLIKEKTRILHGRTRWFAEIGTGDKAIHAYQWLPSPKELKRSKYRQKGKDGFPHPYIFEQEPSEYEDPKGNTGVPEGVYYSRVGSDWRHGNPAAWTELRWHVKSRDNFACRRCGKREDLQVHGIKGRKSRVMEDYETLCRPCHLLEHGKIPREPNQMESRMR